MNINGMFDYDKQGEKRRRRGATNALNVKEDFGLQTCKDMLLGAAYARNNAVNVETALNQLIPAT